MHFIQIKGYIKRFDYYLDTAAKIPAAHIIHVWEPKPYHISWSISKTNPTMIVCFDPNVFIKQVKSPVCAITDKIPTAAINIATAS